MCSPWSPPQCIFQAREANAPQPHGAQGGPGRPCCPGSPHPGTGRGLCSRTQISVFARFSH